MKNFSIFIIKLLTLVVLLFTIGYLIWNIFQPEKAIETPVYKEFYAVKIYSSKNRIKTENLCKKLANFDYDSTIKKKSTFYQLWLSDIFLKDDAIEIGDKLKYDFMEISSYYLVEQKTKILLSEKIISFPKTEKKEKTLDEIVLSVDEINNTTDEKITNFTVQLLASSDKSILRKWQKKLEKDNILTKISKIIKNDKNIYRLRLSANFIDKKVANEKGILIKNNYNFITDFWITKSVTPKNIIKPTPQKMVCKADYVNIRIGPGAYYEIDKIGKLMKDISIYPIRTKNGWIEFSITPNDTTWSGWVKKDFLK